MNLVHLVAAISVYQSAAFLQPPIEALSTTPATRGASKLLRRYGIREWRDQALEYKYTLDSYDQLQTNSPPSSVPATIPILPFPFTDILLQGQKQQLNLYEQRFHELFQDAIDSHCGMVGMGLLAGNGMITTLVLCEIESFSRFGAEESWVDRGDGMGNGSIFVTITAVGRAKIVESDLMQEEPYMKARVVELLDDDITLEAGGSGGLREKSEGKLQGESSPLSVAESVAGNVENLIVKLASMEHKLKQMRKRQKGDNNGEEVADRKLVNAQLESLFMKDSNEGVNLEGNTAADETIVDNVDIENGDEEDISMEENDESDESDRVAQFHNAFESAKESDTFGYISQPTDEGSKQSHRSPKDLSAISWAAFCTGDNSIERDVMKIQALDMTNVLQRLQLASAMLRTEATKLKAKLALAGIKDKKE